MVPLNLSPMARSPGITKWLDDWLDPQYSVARPIDWMYRAQQGGCWGPKRPQTFVWDCPPAAALHALEELARGRLKRRDELRGVVLVPYLMRMEWFRRFTKTVDLYFRVPAGPTPWWPAEMHEPLFVGIF